MVVRVWWVLKCNSPQGNRPCGLSNHNTKVSRFMAIMSIPMPGRKSKAPAEKSTAKPRNQEREALADQALLQANLDAMYIPEVRPVPVWHEFGGRKLSESEHVALVAEAAELREWLVRWYGLVPGDLLCVREWQGRSGKPAGTLAGCVDSEGYLTTWALGKVRRNHHLIWLMYYGRLPAKGMVIDHRNGVKTDNRIENLREITQHGNMLNTVNNDKTLPHGLLRVTMNGGKHHYVRARITLPSTGKLREKSISIQPWPMDPSHGHPKGWALGEDGLPLRNEDEVAAIATLAPLWRSWREELFGVPADM